MSARNVTRPRHSVIHDHVPFTGQVVVRIVEALRNDPVRWSLTEQQFLADLLRTPPKYAFAIALPRLLDMAARCESEAAAYAIANLIYAAIAERRAQRELTLAEVVRDSNAAQYAEDDALDCALQERSQPAWQRAAETALTHARQLMQAAKYFAAKAVS